LQSLYAWKRKFAKSASGDADKEAERPLIEIVKRWDRNGVMQPVWADDDVACIGRGLAPLAILRPGGAGETAFKSWRDRLREAKVYTDDIGDLASELRKRVQGISRCHPRSAFPARHRLGRQHPHETRPGDPGLEDGYRPAIPASGLHLPQPPRQPILLARLPEGPTRAWVQGVDERQRQLLGQGSRRDLLQDHQGRADLAAHVGDPTPGRNRHFPIHQRLL
jgi:hypothetical protein